MKELADQLKDSGSTFWIRSYDVRNREEVYSAINDFIINIVGRMLPG